MKLTLTLQICNKGDWHDAAQICVDDQSFEVVHTHAYLTDYAVDFLNQSGSAAASVNLPVEIANTFRKKPWFGYLDDILPAGPSYRWWINHLGISDLPVYQQKVQLLQHAVIAPIGNLRIKECIQQAQVHYKSVKFTQDDVTKFNRDFLSYAQELGAASGGATGAGGEAPKLLLARAPNGDIWIDTVKDKNAKDSIHYLVKFPRGNNTDIDKDILRSEYYFYHELTQMGVDTIPTQNMLLLESEAGPSLWLPRFDIKTNHNLRTSLGVESIYSLMGVASGGLRHQHVFERLCEVLAYKTVEQKSSFAVEYLWRDLLNIAFCNTDNHGRNMAIMKDGETMKLAPIYDFAPMKFDPEVVTRSTTWGLPLETGGQFDWHKIVKSLKGVDEEVVFAELKEKAQGLQGLYERLESRDVPNSILNAPSAIYARLSNKLEVWGLAK